MCLASTNILLSSLVSLINLISLSFTYCFYSSISAELLIASLLNFQDVYQICEASINTEGENMLRFIFVAIEKRHGAAKLKQIVNEANCDLGKFISGGNYENWLEVNVSTVKCN